MKKEIVYDVDYFINKFESISEIFWISGDYISNSGSCALGHCGKKEFNPHTLESKGLIKLFNENNFIVTHINDGRNSKYIQSTPKQRILAALNDIKRKQNKDGDTERIDITKSLAVLPINETSDLINNNTIKEVKYDT